MSGSQCVSAVGARLLLAAGLWAGGLLAAAGADEWRAGDPRPRKVVLIAGPKSHGPVGNGIHDYPWSVKLLKVMLDNSNVADRVRVEYHLDGWPADSATLDDADAIMVISDGRDGELYAEAPHFQSPERTAAIQKQIDRGCGFLTFHFSTFAPDAYAQQILQWSGGYFDWETDGRREWYSAIQTLEADVRVAAPEHPVARGVQPFRMREEFYYNIRFDPEDKSLVPIWSVPALEGREPDGRVVAWAKERPDGGRGFGTTAGHFYDNWKHEPFRKTILNAITWAARADVPAGGVEAAFYSHAEITAALAGVEGTRRAVVDNQPIRALILTGAQHPAHKWQDTTPAIEEVLERDSRITADVSTNIEDLATPKIREYDLLVLNYCNWQQPGLSDAAKAGFVDYLKRGGGLVIVHFANGAFHFSLPGAGDSDWPEYRRICRRVWDHTEGRSGHDPFGEFVVEIEQPDHPITRGLEAFQTTDELYFRQQGDAPIHVLARARSQVTGSWEPMAFVYEYGDGRVFQTVLGHAPESIRNTGTAALLRRAATWVAGQEPQRGSASPADAEPPAKLPLIEGRFGRALDAKAGAIVLAGRDEYRRPPITVECWAKLRSRESYNILVASDPKGSAAHWELFTAAGNGHFTAYLPGRQPDHVRSGIDICDDQWHHVAMVLEPERVRLFIDGRTVADEGIKAAGGKTVPGGLAVGRLVEGYLGCDGAIDDLRISTGVREFTASPETPLERDQATLGLWPFDAPDELGASLAKPPQPRPDRSGGHWGEQAIGFRWTEDDSVDGRWNRTDVGPFLASIVPIAGEPVAKGLSIRVGEHGEATMCYDTAAAALRAAWTGGFLRFGDRRFGLIEPPQVAGELAVVSRPGAGFTNSEVQYRGLYQHGRRVVLEAAIDGRVVRESPWLETHGGQRAFSRTIVCEEGAQPLELVPWRAEEPVTVQTIDDVRMAVALRDGRMTALAVRGEGELRVEGQPEAGAVRVMIGHPAARLQLLYWSGPVADLPEFAALVKSSGAPDDLVSLLQPGEKLWPETVVTRGVRGDGDGPYVIDTLTLPFDNPWRALLFTSGHDFFSNGDAAICTAHGDVWRVSGIDGDLQELTWRRFATGLFQPLGLKIVDDRVHVLGRDQITVLDDRDGNGEADLYRCFTNAYETSPGGHDYVTCLETDAEGNFYLVHATQGLLRVSPDGRHVDTVATGFRNPNGLGVGPGGELTVAPQEGEWTPASNIALVEPGGHYGYKGPRVAPERPLGYDPPLCWIPRLVDNSSGGQVWVTSDRWGPLAGELLHFSYGQCRMMLVLREQVGDTWQGGTVDFPLNFESGAMRGRFHPLDGQLYVTGLRGWTTRAVRDGCFQRVRYTRRPVNLPAAVRTMQNGVAITFTGSLDRDTAEDPGNYALQAWNYRYSEAYGSPELRPSQPGAEGRDDVEVLSATLLDERTVFLEIPDFRPVDQLTMAYTLNAAGGEPIEQTISYTAHRIGPDRIDPARLVRRAAPGQLPKDAAAALQRGLLARFHQRVADGVLDDARPTRTAAIAIAAGQPATPFLEPGRFQATLTGYIHVPLRGEYTFALEGRGTAALEINGAEVIAAHELGSPPSRSIRLHKGHNAVTIRYDSPPDGDAALQLWWRGDAFITEPVPAHVLFHDPRNERLAAAQSLRRGRELFATHNCRRCHALPETVTAARSLMPELARDVPNLAGLGTRLTEEWIYQWILDPPALRNDIEMPALLDASSAEDRQKAADIAAWLGTLRGKGSGVQSPFLAEENHPTSDRGGPQDLNSEHPSPGAVLYEELGCIACHRFSPAGAADEYGRVSLHYVSEKFQPGALAAFLREPQQHYGWIRMPDFHLSASEAAALAAFLRLRSEGQFAAADRPAGDAQRGRKLFDGEGCAQCHSIQRDDGAKALPATLGRSGAPSYGDLERAAGCLAERPSRQVPQFTFSQSDRSALAAFVATSAGSLARIAPAEDSARLTAALRCTACHSRDGESSPRGLIIAEESDRGRLPETLPDLTWAGEKLRPAWTERLLAGEVSEPMRPWLKARMPAFPAYASSLSAGLAADHGLLPHDFHSTAPQPELASIGRRLVQKDAGLDCRQCHGVGPEPPLGDDQTQIAPGINFALARERLSDSFYRRFVLDPPRYDIGTKMPKLAIDGRTKITSIYDGDAERQFTAIWHYLQTIAPQSTGGNRPSAEQSR